MKTERTIENLCQDISVTAGREHAALTITPSEVGWIIAEFIEGFFGTSGGPSLPSPFISNMMAIADAARRTRDR